MPFFRMIRMEFDLLIYQYEVFKAKNNSESDWKNVIGSIEITDITSMAALCHTFKVIIQINGLIYKIFR